MSEVGTVAHLIDLSIQAERYSETLYQLLAKKFSHHPEVAKFWEMYAKEEQGHAHWLENLRRRVSAEQLNVPADTEMLRQAKDNVSVAPESLVAGIHNLQEAFDLVNEIEHAETNTVFEFLIAHFAEDQHTQTFLRSQLRDHIGRLLMEFPQKYRQPAVRRAIEVVQE